MKPLWQVLLILAVCGAITFASNFEPFRLERLTSQDSQQAKDDKINRNSERNERRDRDLQERDNSRFPQTDTSRTDANGYDTIYLPIKYVSNNFMTVVMPTTVSLIAVNAISDSSFDLALFDHTGTGHSVYYRWYTLGEISSE